jgi:hypothetical protein
MSRRIVDCAGKLQHGFFKDISQDTPECQSAQLTEQNDILRLKVNTLLIERKLKIDDKSIFYRGLSFYRIPQWLQYSSMLFSFHPETRDFGVCTYLF